MIIYIVITFQQPNITLLFPSNFTNKLAMMKNA